MFDLHFPARLLLRKVRDSLNDLVFAMSLTCTILDWGHVTLEKALEPDRSEGYVYFASKLLAERALWEFAKEHPQLDVVTGKYPCTPTIWIFLNGTLSAVLPGYVFGPWAETYPRPITKDNLGTNAVVYGVMSGPSSQFLPFVVDVRDVAKTHVLSLELPRNPGALERRYIAVAGNISVREAVDHLRISHPDLKLPPTDQYGEMPGPSAIFDTSDTIADLKFGKFREPKQVFDDTVDALLEVQKTWVE
jgi:nucleoside-diphosphate-sugar epimerase